MILIDGQPRASPNVQQVQPQTLQPAGAPPSAGTLSRYRFHWSHAFIAVGLLAASGAGTAVLIKVYSVNLRVGCSMPCSEWYCFYIVAIPYKFSDLLHA